MYSTVVGKAEDLDFSRFQYVPDAAQLEGANFIVHTARGRVFLNDVMGLGKTGTSYLAMHMLRPNHTLVVCGKNAQWTWISESAIWGYTRPIIIKGTAAQRQELWQRLEQQRAKGYKTFAVCTRAVLMNDLKSESVPKKWSLIITDEAHKDSNRKTQSYKALKSLESKWFFALTGNRLRADRLWGILHLINKQQYPSYWKFMSTFCQVDDGPFGKEFVGVKNVDGLRHQLSTIRLRREKDSMPPKRRFVVPIEMDTCQERLYTELLEEAMIEVGRRLILAPNQLTKLTRVRQLLCCPKILDPSLTYGGAIEALIEKLDEASPDMKQMVVFSPFRASLKFVNERLLAEGYEQDSIITLHGGIEPEELDRRIQQFKLTKGIVLCTTRFAESFSLVPAQWSYHLGYEWEPDVNYQAEDRIHRGKITHGINCYYAQYMDTLDTEIVRAVLDNKTRYVNLMYGTDKKIIKCDP